MKTIDLVVIGGGPGGYSAAFRAADLGMKVMLVERFSRLGGVCLNVGCIPSKTLLHAAGLIEDAAEWRDRGVVFDPPRIDLDALRDWKERGVAQLADGLGALAKRREVEVVTGRGEFVSAHTLAVETGQGREEVRFAQAIIATGSRPIKLELFPDDPRILDSTSALDLEEIPKRLLVVGGGVLGLELATVFRALGSQVTVVEALEQMMGEADKDVVRAYLKRNAKRFAALHTGTQVQKAEAKDDGILVQFEGADRQWEESFDAVLVAVGRAANSENLGLEDAGVAVGGSGAIPVNHQQRTNIPHIFAIGDVTGGPMLAHRASYQGRLAAEVAAGMKSAYEARVVPSVAYTDPEVAWVGLTEREAKAQGVAYDRGIFPWAASGRAVGTSRVEGMTKLLFDSETKRLIGAAVVGVHAGELIAEAALAIETGCEAEDIAGTIHPHPTFSETLAQASEVVQGTVTELFLGRSRGQ
ncbi:MAG: dihydrolipoyl dehydrogenase [Gammaproteobacteria bacterium]|nr:dihydrolipoyl dehydrogenase [Gammaproteobacteria bacterium]